MPRSGSGTYTLPSGNPVVTGTTIESNWANTTLSDIATTLTDSLSRSGQGGMTAALRVADGTQGAPGVGFANETGSGFYRAGTGEVWAVVQGAQTLNLDANGVTVPSDKATSIEGTFVFNETGADKDARFEGDTDANLLFVDASTDRVGVGTNTPASKLTVSGSADVTGDLGVGTNTPSSKLDVYGTVNPRITVSSAAATAPGFTISQSGQTAVSLFQPASSSDLVFYNSAERMRLDSSGNLGIGTSSPGYKLDVRGVTASGNGTITTGFSYDTRGLVGTFSNHSLGFLTNGAVVGTWDSSGNLGLGVTPSAWKTDRKALQVNYASLYAGNTANYAVLGNNIYIDSAGAVRYISNAVGSSYAQDTSGAHSWNIFTGNTGAGNAPTTSNQAMTLDASGNLGVGTTSPESTLHVAKSSSGSKTTIYIDNAASAAANNAASIKFSVDGGASVSTGGAEIQALINSTVTGSTHLLFSTFDGTTLAERARITSGGDLLVGTTDSSATAGVGFKTSNGRPICVRSETANSQSVWDVYSTGAAAYRFYVGLAGTIYATNTTITAISDQRLKENIRDLDVGLDKIMALKPRKFDWKAGKGKDKKGDRGWIAQEFEQVFPDMVDTWLDPAPEGEAPYKAVNADLIPVLVKAIQEQQALITALTARVAALEAQP